VLIGWRTVWLFPNRQAPQPYSGPRGAPARVWLFAGRQAILNVLRHA
jgi:hypothetical protein